MRWMLAAAVASTALVSTAYAAPVKFVAYGDMPYFATDANDTTDEEILKRQIAPIVRREDDIRFVVHYGDSGRPENVCNDAWLREMRRFWVGQLTTQVFFTPGDNDWTDCDRSSMPTPVSELSRLDAIREILFSKPQVGIDPKWHYVRQAAFPENARWIVDGVQFATLHVVGTNNGRAEVLLDDPATALQLVEARDLADVAWIDEAFAQAQQWNAGAVVFTVQADMFVYLNRPACTDAEPVNCDGFSTVRQHLVEQSKLWGGPVLLIHGDTGAYCFDQPFLSDEASNIWRLNGPGDFAVLDAAEITVDASDAEAPFKVEGLLSETPPPASCN